MHTLPYTDAVRPFILITTVRSNYLNRGTCQHPPQLAQLNAANNAGVMETSTQNRSDSKATWSTPWQATASYAYATSAVATLRSPLAARGFLAVFGPRLFCSLVAYASSCGAVEVGSCGTVIKKTAANTPYG